MPECGANLANPSVGETGITFLAVAVPSYAGGQDHTVPLPPPPLALGARGGEAALLQKTLTDVGLMTLGMYYLGVGLYGANTARPVQAFREMYGLGARDRFGVHDSVVASSMRSLLESCAPPAAARPPALLLFPFPARVVAPWRK